MLRLRLLAAVVAACAFLAAPAAAHAALTVTTSTPQAGAPADLTINASFDTNPAGGPLKLHLPAGLVGNPGPPHTQCSEDEFQSDSCPPGSQVGTASANGLASGGVFNMKRQGDEPARLGIVVSLKLLGVPLLQLAHNEASVSVRPDGGLDSTITNLASPLSVTSLDLTLNSDFITMPTSCGTKTVTMESAGMTQQGHFAVTGCGAVPFAPSAAMTVTNHQRTQPTGATVTLTVPNTGNPRQSHVKRAEVKLPVGTTLNPGVANGLQACSASQFAGGNCPPASQIGTVGFNTPLIADPLPGRVYFGQPANGAYPLLVAVDSHGVHLKLTGTVTLDPRTGQISTVFDNLPQVPFTSFSLKFNGGDRGVLANPPACGDKTLTATLTPWSGNKAKSPTATYSVTGCQSPTPFRPSLAVASDSTKAGRPAGGLAITISRPDGDQDFGAVETQLPPGLAGKLTGVPVCPEDAANAGACPAETRLGSVSALVGSGGAPVQLNGTVYLTGPAIGGLAGLAIVIPGKVGPVDLGTVVVRAGLLLRPADGGVTVRTAPLPPLVGGVPVSVRSLTLRLDRPGFTINPSGCDTRTVVANLTGSEGGTATATAPYTATDCAGLAYKPKLTASIARRGPKHHAHQPQLSTTITIPDGQSSTRKVQVKLPEQLIVDLTAIKSVCTFAQADAGACPASSRVGSVRASSPLLPIPLAGPVYTGQVPGSPLPGLRLQLHGPADLNLSGTLAIGKRLVTTFDNLPDVPLSSLRLTFAGAGPITLVGNACTGKLLRLDGTLTGHNGTVVHPRQRAKVRNCAPTSRLRLTKGATPPRAQLTVGHGRDAKRLKRVVLKAPKGMRLHRGAGRVRVTRDGRHKVARTHVKVTAHTLTVTLPKSKRATIALDRGALTGHPHGRAKVTLVRTNGKKFTVRPKAARLR